MSWIDEVDKVALKEIDDRYLGATVPLTTVPFTYRCPWLIHSLLSVRILTREITPHLHFLVGYVIRTSASALQAAKWSHVMCKQYRILTSHGSLKHQL